MNAKEYTVEELQNIAFRQFMDGRSIRQIIEKVQGVTLGMLDEVIRKNFGKANREQDRLADEIYDLKQELKSQRRLLNGV